MRVGIDLRPLRRELSGGVVQFVEDLCPSLFEAGADDSFVVYHAAGGYRLDGPQPGHVRQVELPDTNDPSRLDRALANDHVDVLFRPFPCDDTLAFPARRQCTLVPDLQHEDHPEFFSEAELEARRRAFGVAIERGGAIGLLSRHAEARLRAHAPCAGTTLVQIPPGTPTLELTLATPLSADEERAIPDGPYFLYPSNLWVHKNHSRIIRAFERFLSSRSDGFSLVLTGSTVGNGGLLDEAGDLPIVHLGFVTRRLLAELYRRSVALTYFSLYEGFGLPVLEAFQLRVPVLCSNTTSLPEVAEDAALQCDSTDIEAMAAAMARIADSGELRTTLVARGTERLAGFNWGSSARRLLGALRTIASTPLDHDDVLRAIRLLDDRVTHDETNRREVSAALVERDREIEVLRIVLRERTTWAEQSVASAEARLDIIRGLEADLVTRAREVGQLEMALQERSAWAEESLRSAEERLDLIHDLEAVLASRDREIAELQKAVREHTTQAQAASRAAEERQAVITTLEVAVRERTAWGDRMLKAAEERLGVIHTQVATIHAYKAAIQAKDAEIHAKDGALREQQRALDEWTTRGAEMAEEYRQVAAAADERLRLIEQLHGQAAAGVGQTSHAQAGPAGAPPPPGDR